MRVTLPRRVTTAFPAARTTIVGFSRSNPRERNAK